MLRPTQCALTGLALTAALFWPRFASSQSVYIAGAQGEFGTVNLATGAYSNIATTSEILFSLASASNGTLYGMDAVGTLYTVNTATGALTTMGTTTVGAVGQDNFPTGMAFRSDGTLFASDSNSNLYTINTATAATTLVGPTGNASTGTIAFAGNTLYQSDTTLSDSSPFAATDILNTLNQTTGAGTPLPNMTGFQDIYGMASTNNTLYGITFDDEILTLDTTTGVGTQIGTIDASFDDGVYAAALVPSTPAPDAMATALLGAIPGAGLLLLRRRKQRLAYSGE